MRRTWLLALGVSLGLTTYLTWRLTSEDKTLYLPGETGYGHYQIELKCESCHQEGDAIASDACAVCHAEELALADDSHPKSKFLDPRNATLLAKLDARACVTCHTEHRPMLTQSMGVTVPGDYCFHCHADIGEERPTHLGLDHQSCQNAGCHNFHDNRGLHPDYLEAHLDEPFLLARPARLRTSPRDTDAPALTRSDADAPPSLMQPEALAEWAGSAHAAVTDRVS